MDLEINRFQFFKSSLPKYGLSGDVLQYRAFLLQILTYGLSPVLKYWTHPLKSVSSAKYSLSPSMEECEALCTRLAIMVKGRFKFLDSPQQLKSRFSDIYTLTVKIKIDKNENKQKEFKEFIATTFPGNIDRADLL